MKTELKIWGCAAAGLSLLPALGGCNLLPVPEPEEVPTTLSGAKKPDKPVFTPTDYITPGVKRAGSFRVASITSGDTLGIQSVVVDAKGKSIANPVIETVRLSGIVAPPPGQPGAEGSRKTVQNWTVVKDPVIEIEDDPKFPLDEDQNKNVQVYFNGTTEATKGTRYNLNRMMVRSGWALVDLHTATNVDLQLWLNDQEHARRTRQGLWANQATLAWVYKALQVPRPRLPGGGRTGGGNVPGAAVISKTPGGGTKVTAVGKTGQTTTTVSPAPEVP